MADHLSRSVSALGDLDRARDIVLMVEVQAEAGHVPHHRKKIAFLFSAMRHFARALEAEGISVDYVTLDDPANRQSFQTELARAIERHDPERVILTEPGEHRVLAMARGWSERLGLPVEIRADDRFLCPHDTFAAWAEGRGSLRMESFYRMMRRRTGWLMTEDGEPAGGSWNYDRSNRRPPKAGLAFPRPAGFAPDAITEEVLELVERHFPDRFGDLTPFWFAVTREDALQALDHFIEHALADFGPYQDAMVEGEDWLFHSALSQYLNAGLLLPAEVGERAIAAYEAGRAPIESVEGFIRQILGWRDYVRAIYDRFMPDYAEWNALGARRPLPAFYWDGRTDMHCLARVIDQTRREAQSHHIQRLMVTGNFALLAGVAPKEIALWYLAVYADAFEWVELPNVHGMVMHADGGLLGSKPYAAGGNYINKMSDFCRHCRYDVKKKTGDKACPFNYLYWHFMIENRDELETNPRLGPVYRTLDRMDEDRRAAILADSRRFLDSLEPWRPVETAA